MDGWWRNRTQPVIHVSQSPVLTTLILGSAGIIMQYKLNGKGVNISEFNILYIIDPKTE